VAALSPNPKGARTIKRTRYTQPKKPHELDTLRLLTSPEQFEVITAAMTGEEGDHFIEIIDRIHATWQTMPKTYETLNQPKSEADAGRADLDFSAGNPAAGEAPEKARPHRPDPGAASALAHLHYFTGGCDWWIVEKDADPDHAGQVQAFGVADLGMGAELGYISIPELLENGAKLDLHYTEPKTIGELLA
jgi:hypothetical protein